MKVSRTPLPFRRMTTPWKTCTRSRVALDDADVHLEGVAGPEVGEVVAQCGAVDEVGGVHDGLQRRVLGAEVPW